MHNAPTRIGAIALAAGLMASLAACNPGAARAPQPGTGSAGATASSGASPFTKDMQGTLRTSGFNPSDEVGKSRSDLAAKAISPATVSMDTTNFDTQKFAAQAASGQVPDLLQVNRNVVGTLADKGLIVPLDECLRLWDVDPKERWYDAVLNDVTYDGKLYAVPQFFQTSILIGNKRVMEAGGVTADQLDTSKPDALVEVARKLYKESGGKPSVLGFDGDLPGSAGLWLAVFGGAPSDAKGKPTLDNPKNAQALTWMKRLMDAQGGYAGVKSLKDSMDTFGNENQYVKDTVGVQTWAQWYINVLSNTKDAVSLVGVPIKTTGGQTLGYAGGTSLAIPSGGKNPSAACRWAVEATSPEAWDAAGAARAETVKTKNSVNTGLFTGSPVADKSIREKYVKPSGNADFDQVIEASYQSLQNTASFGASPVGQAVNDALTNAVASALSGEKAPDAALADAQAAALRAWNESALGKKG